ncbi:hypothetical protein GR243_03525 [Rhizobium leguminosarum]|nr:hypothetical protein [Rhizobium leguminosarum]
MIKAGCEAQHRYRDEANEREVRMIVEAALQQHEAASVEHPIGWELSRVTEQLADGAGAWRACSGCHELNEGHPTGEWSDILKSHLGLGCSECGGIGAVWDNIDYSMVTELDAEQAVGAAIVPPLCSGSALGFDPGTLYVNKDGSGYIAVNEDDFVLEDDRCEGPNGPEGSVHWIVRLDASEITALRDFLNGAPRTHGTVADYATRLFDLHGFMLLEAYREKPAVTVTFPDLKQAQQFHNTLVELSTHRSRPRTATEGSADV